MIRFWRRQTRAAQTERGSVSLWMVTAASAMIILAGLAVDLGGQVHTRQHVRSVAAQAARAGGQELQIPQAIRGEGVRTNPVRAAAAARAYLDAANVTGTVQVRGGAIVVVNTTASYQTIFLGIIGIDRLEVSGSAESRTVRAVDGVER